MKRKDRVVDHTITLDCGQIKRDGCRARITVDADRTWIYVGCTRVSFAALKRLYEMTSKYEQPNEVVVQEGY